MSCKHSRTAALVGAHNDRVVKSTIIQTAVSLTLEISLVENDLVFYTLSLSFQRSNLTRDHDNKIRL